MHTQALSIPHVILWFMSCAICAMLYAVPSGESRRLSFMLAITTSLALYRRWRCWTQPRSSAVTYKRHLWQRWRKRSPLSATENTFCFSCPLRCTNLSPWKYLLCIAMPTIICGYIRSIPVFLSVVTLSLFTLLCCVMRSVIYPWTRDRYEE